MPQNTTEVSVLKIRIRFSKSGALVYIGHLDVMRYFQKLFRRADIPVAYSEGFSPHQILSFTPPLPLGMESEGEYADVEIIGNINGSEALRRLRAQSVPEIVIHSFKELPERCQNAMASVRAARYTVSFENVPAQCDLKEIVSLFNKKSEIPVVKKTKKSEKTIDLRPLVYELTADENSNKLGMLISSGSTDNIKPEHVLEALFEITGNKMFDQSTADATIKRIDQYAMIDEKLISLDDIGIELR